MKCINKKSITESLINSGIIDDKRVLQPSQVALFEKVNLELTSMIESQLNMNFEGKRLFEVKQIKKKALKGHAYYRDNYKTFERVEFNKEIIELIENSSENPSLNFEPIDLYELENEESYVPSYEEYIKYKENLLRRLQQRLASVKADKRKYADNTDLVKKLTKHQTELENRIQGSPELNIKGLEQEIIELEKKPPIEKLVFYAEKDFERLQDLSQSEDMQDLHEAKVIINFYKAVGDFNLKQNHPLFNLENNFNEKGESILPQETLDILSDLRNRAELQEGIIESKIKKAVMDIINSNRKVNEVLGKNLKYEDVFNTKDGLKDAHWVDMFLMDITNGIFSQNGIVPQVMMNLIQNFYGDNLVYAKSVENRVNDIQSKVEKELSKMGHSISVPGIKGVSYDLFRAMDENGNYKDSITQRYTSNFFEEKKKMQYELDQKLIKAKQEEDPSKRATLFSQAFAFRDNWYRKNTEIIDVRKIPEITGDESLSSFKEHFKNDDGYVNKLKNILGEQGYKEEVNKQIKLLRNYQTALDVFTDSLIVENGYNSIEDFDENAKSKLNMWVKRNNPFIMIEHHNNNTTIMKDNLKLNSTMSYNYAVPRRNKVNLKITTEGYSISNTEDTTGFYDERYEVIENNEVLKEFHNLLMEVQNKIYDTMPLEMRKNFNAFSIPAVRKKLTEILFDKNLSLYQRISKAANEIIQRIKDLFGVTPQSSLSYANVDPITGKPEYQVNTQFLKSNKQEIDKLYQVELLRLKKALGLGALTKLTQYDTFDIDSLSQEVVDIIAENLQIEPNHQAIKNRFPNSDHKKFELAKALKDGITHQVVQNQSFDLPKILKLYSYLTMEYAARQEVLPMMEMLKQHYQDMKAPSTTNLGKNITNKSSGKTRLEGERKKANLQMESWFERVVLGNYGSKNEFGDTRIKRQGKLLTTGNKSIDNLTSKLKTTVTGKILNDDEKLVKGKIEDILDDLNKELKDTKDEEQRKELGKLIGTMTSKKNNLGKEFSAASAFDALFNFIRFKGLGWNLSSSVTNFMEGQIANMTIAATGDYFTPENIYRANDIVKGSFAKNLSFGKYVTPGAKKARALMDRYAILQDASNELQKASAKSAFSSFRNLDPYEITRRTEYLNQTPLMIATLMDIKIKSGNTIKEKYSLKAELNDSFDLISKGEKTSITRNLKTMEVSVGDIVKINNGNKSVKVKITGKKDLRQVQLNEWLSTSKNEQSVYDKLIEKGDYEYYTFEKLDEGNESSVWDAMNPDGTLKEEFRTEENIKNWENAEGDSYNDFSSKMRKMIVNAHGDYDELRGMMASEYISGKALLMFKRWMSRQIYQRFAMIPQTDLETGIKEYKGRYLSHTQASGFLHGSIIGFGGLALLGAGPLGAVVGGTAGLLAGKFWGANTGLNFLQELAFVGKELALNILRIPVNNIAGKAIIKNNDYKRLSNGQLSDRDIRNMKANLIDMSLTLSWIALTLFTKALLWDDEDEEDSSRRKAHNLLTNRFMQLSSQSAMYVNPTTWKDVVGELPIIRFFEDVGKTAAEAQDFLEGKDTIASGPNAGESALYNQLERTFFPGILKGGIGFESHMGRQFEQSPFDSWFFSPEKVAKTKAKTFRAKYKKELVEQGFEGKELIKKLNSKYKPKKKGQTYEQLVEQYEKVE